MLKFDASILGAMVLTLEDLGDLLEQNAVCSLYLRVPFCIEMIKIKRFLPTFIKLDSLFVSHTHLKRPTIMLRLLIIVDA